MANQPAPHKLSFGGIQLGTSLAGVAHQIGPETPMRIAVFGDFSGRANRGICQPGKALADHRCVLIDRDNFEEVLGQLDVRLDKLLTDSDGQPVSIAIRELDDFHPDRLFARVKLFESLRGIRRRLLNTATFRDAAAEMQEWAVVPEPPPQVSRPVAKTNATAVPENLLEQTLTNSEQSLREPSQESSPWNALIQEIIAPYIVPGADPRQTEYVDCVDKAIGKTMRTILHHLAFQSLESNWWALYWLVRQLETGTRLKIYLMDISQQELAADLAGEDLTKSGLYDLLVGRLGKMPGDQPWGLLVGSYAFGDSDSDVELLGRIAKIAAAAGAPWLTSATGAVVGCPDPQRMSDTEDWLPPTDAGWKQLRQLPEASLLALAWPRFLVRMPYGLKFSSTESFAFEEPDGPTRHEHLLWGNAAYLVASVLGQAFVESGWKLKPDRGAEFGGLPSFSYEEDGETLQRPCGELLLTERGVERVVAQGIIPVLSVRGQDVVRIARVAALNGQPLAGRWR
jgi:type VI secretion system protein ImpC